MGGWGWMALRWGLLLDTYTLVGSKRWNTAGMDGSYYTDIGWMYGMCYLMWRVLSGDSLGDSPPRIFLYSIPKNNHQTLTICPVLASSPNTTPITRFHYQPSQAGPYPSMYHPAPFKPSRSQATLSRRPL